MSQNDYIILRDENGKAYIAHAGLLDNARNAIRGAANSISTTAQQVANKAKGVGRGVRQNHKYILKVNENGRTRYFYKQEEVKAYYEAKRKGIKNPAEYAQKAADAASNVVDTVKNVASKAGNAAKSAFREATGQAARDRMDEAANRRDNAASNMHNANTRRQKAENDKAIAEQKRAEALSDIKNARTAQRGLQEKIDKDTDRINAVDRKKNNDEHVRLANSLNLSQRALDTQRQKEMEGYRRENIAENKRTAAKKEIDLATSEHMAARDAYQEADSNYNKNKAAYDKSLAGAVDRTATRAKETASSAFSKAKDAANNAVSNAKNAYERMRGEFRDKTGQTLKARVEATEQEAKDAEHERQKVASRYNHDVDAVLKSEKNLNANPNSAHAQAERDRTVSDYRKSSEDYYKDGGALDTAWSKSDEAIKAREEYNDFKKSHSAQAMLDRARTAIKDKSEDLSAKAKKSADNAVANAKANYDRMKSEFRDKAEQAGNAAKSAANKVADKARDIAGYDERDRRDAASDYAWDLASKGKLSNEALDQQRETEKQYRKTPLGMIDTARDKIGLTARKAMKDLEAERDGANASNDPSGVRKFNADSMARSAKAMYQETPLGKLESFAANPRATVKDSINGMIDNARSSTAKAVNEAWDKIPKNSDGTVNPFDKNFQSTYNDWKANKDKYDSSLAGRAKDAAEKTTESVKDMIDQAKKVAKGNSSSANARATKSSYGEYSDNDKDFAEKNYSNKNHVEDTDFYTFKRDDGKWVILEEDMKWVLPEGVTGNDPGVRNALKQFADHASSAKAIGNENYNADQWVDAVTDAIDKAAEKQRKR